MLARMRRKRISFALLVRMQTGAATLENSMKVPQKIKNRTILQPSIALLGIYPKDTEVLIRRGMRTPMFIAALSTIAKVWKESQCPSTDEWKKKMWYMYIYIYNGILLSHQKTTMRSFYVQ